MVDYDIHGLVTVRSNVSLPIPDYFNKDITEPDIEFREEDLDLDVPRSEKKKRKDYSVWQDGDTFVVDYEILNLKVALDDLQGATVVRFTPRFGERSKNHINSLSKLLIQLKLVEQGYSFIHAGSFTVGDEAILIPAMGSTGKTYTSLSLVNGDDRLFMGDDLAIVGEDGSVFSYPGKIGTGPYVLQNDDVPELNFEPTLSARLAKIPLISVIFGQYPWLYKSKNTELPSRLIADEAEVGAVYLITGGTSDKAVPISSSEAVSRGLIQHFDTHGMFQNFILNYCAFFQDYDLTEVVERMREILESGLSDTPCYELRSNELNKYPELVRTSYHDEF